MKIRLEATSYIWGAFTLMILGLMSTIIFGGDGLGGGHVIIAVVLAIAAFLSTGTVWNWGDVRDTDVVKESSKQKRSTVERVVNELDAMSEDDLERLRTRLSADVRDVLVTPTYGVSDEGELLRR